MKVHIVCDRPKADRILPRLARYLAEGCGWTLTDQPKSDAELNYFLNYITWRQHHANWHGTPLAAFFTHKDLNNATKAQWWEDAALGMDLRCVVAPQYAELLRRHGPTALVYPPVERERFTIGSRPSLERPVVGMSGYTYQDGRKGEQLVRALAASPLAKRLYLRGSGRGWSVPTRSYPWDKMHLFYQGLDVLVCPSLVEGIPMPPLEALACGVKVVVPRGVGMLDELADIVGIYRYEAGKAQALIEAVEQAAFSGEVDREALRAATEIYTRKSWCDTHLAAFDEFLYGLPVGATGWSPQRQLADRPSWQGCSGVYMVAFGEPSRRCAERAIRSVHQHMPGLPVCLCSTEPLGSEDVFVRRPDADIGGRSAKLKMDELSPQEWKYVLYLDADIEVLADISFLLQVLADGWELVICKDMAKYHTAAMMRRPDNEDECQATWELIGTQHVLQYNGGMMAFRRCKRTAGFFRLWQREWQRWGKRDQAALLRTLHQHPLRLFVLCNQWNASTRYPRPPGEIAILHHNMEARRWGGIVWARTDSPEAWEAVQKWERKQVHE